MSKIFTLTPGRSGSHWLSAFMWVTTSLPHTSKPEPFPLIHHHGTKKEKQKAVNEIWGKTPEEYMTTSFYANHYIEQLAEKGARFVHLKRNVIDNAKSLYKMGMIPGSPGGGQAYHFSLDDPENSFVFDKEGMTDFDLCLWICLEIEARAKWLSNTSDVMTVDIEDVSWNRDSAEEFLEWTGFDYGMEFYTLVIGRHLNTFEEQPEQVKINKMSSKEARKQARVFEDQFAVQIIE